MAVLANLYYPSYIFGTTLPAWCTALFWGGALAGAGAELSGRISGRTDGFSDPLIGFAFGCGVFGLSLFVLGQLGLFSDTALTLLSLAGWFLGFRQWKAWILHVSRRNRTPMASPGILGVVAWGAILVFSVLLAAYASLPPVLFDSMAYHLALPEQWLLSGRMIHWEHHLMSHYPTLLSELLLLPPLALSGAEAANAFTALAAFVTAGLLARLTGRFFDDSARPLAAALALSVPLFAYLASDVKSDGFLALFEVAAFAALLESSTRKRFLLVAGWLTGCAVATKYSALVFAPTLLLVGLVFHWKESGRIRFLLAGALGLGLLLCLPFYLRTWILTGSPVYPHLTGVFGAAPGVDYVAVGREIQALHSLSDLGTFLFNLALAPGKIDGDHAVIGLGFLMLSPFLLFADGLGRPARICALLWALQLPALFFMTTKLRLFPLFWLLPVPMIAAGMARAWVEKTSWRAAALAFFLLAMLHHAALQLELADIFFTDGGKVLAGSITKETYLKEKLPSYEAFRKIGEIRPSGGVWIEGENRLAYTGCRAYGVSAYESGFLERAAAAGETPSQAVEPLRQKGIELIFFSFSEFRRIKGRDLPNEFLQGLIDSMELIYHDERGFLLRIKSAQPERNAP